MCTEVSRYQFSGPSSVQRVPNGEAGLLENALVKLIVLFIKEFISK